MSDRDNRSTEDSIVTILQSRARLTPDRIAYGMLDSRFRLSEITYSQLYADVSALADSLAARRLAEGDRCLLMFPQGLEFIAAFLACLRIGVIPVPVNMPGRHKSLERWEKIAADCGASCLLADQASAESLQGIISGSSVLSALPVFSTRVEEERGLPAAAPVRGEIALLQYTSGSTSDPKGVRVTHSSLLNNLKQLERKFDFGERSVMVSWLPFYHDMGLIIGILQGIYSGFKVILMKPNDFMQQPLNWLRAISRYGGTHTGAPNFAYELAAERLDQLETTQAEDGALSLRTLERAFCGAEPIRLETLLKFKRAAKRFGLRENVLSPGYGLAEASLAVSTYRPGQPVGWLRLDKRDFQRGHVNILGRGNLETIRELPEGAEEVRLVGSGYVVDEHRLSIRNPDNGEEVGDGAIGEVCFAGPSVTGGYWNRPEETSRAFRREKDSGRMYLRTGDYGFRDANGELYITGRIKDLIIVRGMNYYPQDIERIAFLSDPALRSDGAAAFSVESEEGEERVVVIQEVERRAVRSAACGRWARQIRQRVLRELELMVDTVVFVPPMQVPRTTSGKIRRGRAKAMYLSGEWDRAIGVNSRSDSGPLLSLGRHGGEAALADFIAGLIAEQLAVPADEVDRNAPFMELGLNSAMSLSVRYSLEQALGVHVPATLLFNYNTVTQISRHLAAPSNSRNRPGAAVAREVASDAEFGDLSEDELLERLRYELGGTNHV